MIAKVDDFDRSPNIVGNMIQVIISNNLNNFSVCILYVPWFNAFLILLKNAVTESLIYFYFYVCVL